MKRGLIVIVLSVLFLVAACSSSVEELPPEPGAPGVVQDSVGVPVGQGTKGQNTDSVDLKFSIPREFTLSKEKIALALNEKSEIKIDLKAVHPEKYGYVFSEGHRSDDKNVFIKFNYQGEKIEKSKWIREHATYTLPVNLENFDEGKNYIASYTCKRKGDDFDCNNKQWMLHTFVLEQKPLSITEDVVTARVYRPLRIMALGKEYMVKVKEIKDSKVTLEVGQKPDIVTLEKNQARNIDLDGDAQKYDLKITLKDIVENVPVLLLQQSNAYISPEAPESPQ
jgi:hypothetical protein